MRGWDGRVYYARDAGLVRLHGYGRELGKGNCLWRIWALIVVILRYVLSSFTSVVTCAFFIYIVIFGLLISCTIIAA